MVPRCCTGKLTHAARQFSHRDRVEYKANPAIMEVKQFNEDLKPRPCIRENLSGTMFAQNTVDFWPLPDWQGANGFASFPIDG